MTTKYKILFMVDLLNEYYTNLQCRDFSVVPSAATQKVLQGHQLLFKTVGNKVVVLTKVRTDAGNEDKPFVPVAPDTSFLFYLHLNQPVFTTITNLDTDKLRQSQRYYVTNFNQNKAGTSLHLSKKIAKYSNTATYNPGDLVDNGTGTLFECIQRTTGNKKTTNAAFWFNRGKEQYISAADMLPFIGTSNRFQVSTAATSFAVSAFGFNTLSNQYDRTVLLTKSQYLSDEPVKEVLVDLSVLTPGRYKICINTDVFDVFVDDTVMATNAFGVIEIFNHLPAGDFSLLDSSGKVKDTVSGGTLQWLHYQIRFANRLAFWKYVIPRKGVKSITDKTSAYKFVQSPALPAAAASFQSDKPIPIKQTPAVYDMELAGAGFDEDPPAPNPDPNVTGMLTRTEPGKDYYCTIYLHY